MTQRQRLVVEVCLMFNTRGAGSVKDSQPGKGVEVRYQSFQLKTLSESGKKKIKNNY